MTRVARDLFLPVAAQPRLERFVSLSERAEAAGYERVWLPETWGRDAVTVLATVARATDRVGIGTSITNVYSRSPALIGQTAATLQEASGGRFRLGLGPSGPILVEGWHSVGYEDPLRRTREAAVGAVGDGLLDEIAAAGHPEECRERLGAFERVEGVDAVSVGFPRAAKPGELAATADALAPE